MKFATQHKPSVSGLDKHRPKDKYGCHRQGAQVWITSDTAIVRTRTFDTVRQAKAWINRPYLFS